MRDEDNNVSRLEYDPQIKATAEAVFRLSYRIHMLTVFNKTMRRDARRMKQTASSLLILLNKEYHLK